MTLAAIDLGSNSFRLLVGTITAGEIAVLEKRTITTRLGAGLTAGGRLSTAAMDRALDALTDFAAIMRRHRVRHLLACGTEALRRAANSDGFLARAVAVIEAPVRIISPDREARLTLAGCLHGAPLSPGPLRLVDSGGASTECIAAIVHSAAPYEVQWLDSVAVGAVTLTERFFSAPQPPYPLAEARAWLDHLFVRTAWATRTAPDIRLVAAGGTATALAALDLALERYQPGLVHGHRLDGAALAALVRRLAALGTEERNRLPALGRGRGEIILAGAVLIERLTAALGADTITVSDRGLLEGIFLAAARGEDLWLSP